MQSLSKKWMNGCEDLLNLFMAIILGIAMLFNLFNGDAEWFVIDAFLFAFNLAPAIVWWHETMK